MNGWRSMDTAPLDGTKVLLWCPDLDDMIQGLWRAYDIGGEWVDIWNNDPIESTTGIAAPSAWMPRPEPPGSL